MITKLGIDMGLRVRLRVLHRSHDPLADIDWVHQELHRWIFANVHRKWESIQKHPQRLPGMFTGIKSLSSCGLLMCIQDIMQVALS